MTLFTNIDRKALGRGLSALISDKSAVPPDISSDSNDNSLSENLATHLIHPNPHQPRKEFKEGELEELAISIKQHGILQPVIVRKFEDGYQLIAGERRWQAAKRAGLKLIPSIIKQLSDIEMLEVALVENLQRENLNPIEEAIAIKKLMDENRLTQLEISQKIGKSRSYVANSIRLLNLPEDVKNKVTSGEISPGHARNLVGRKDASKLAQEIIMNNLSVREIEKINKAQASHANNNAVGEVSDFIALERAISESLGVPVKIKIYQGAGTVTIRFANLDELDGIIQCLGSGDLNF